MSGAFDESFLYLTNFELKVELLFFLQEYHNLLTKLANVYQRTLIFLAKS